MTAPMRVFAFFHLNLAFSSIAEERRGDVIAQCYWPLLTLAEQHGPIGIEATGYTLEEIAARDPAWIDRARELIGAGKVELIGSGYSQMIGPLAPARVTRENLRLGMEIYARLLGVRPRIALVNEQAYAGGLVPLYREAGFDAILMDWENPSAQHPEWGPETRYLPQYAAAPDGSRIGLLFSNTTAFQQMQRLAHGDIALGDYRAFLARQRGRDMRALCLYASDAEVFDFRPGRFKTEEKLSGGEWARIAGAFQAARDDGAVLVKPSDVLAMTDLPGAGQTLTLESPACPVPVKKQRKYNLARWAVTGRDNLGINAACQRIYEEISEREHRAREVGDFAPARATQKSDWKELCYLWSSDFRTHLTEPRWTALCDRLRAADPGLALPDLAAPQSPPVESRFIDIEMPHLTARLDRRRGLAIQRLHFKSQARPAIGGLPHGYFDDIALAADWYTGDSVFEAPGEHKVTDLEWCEARIEYRADGDVIAFARIETPRGVIEKELRFSGAKVAFDLAFHGEDWRKGVLRLGHITLLPDAFDHATLTLTTANGGGDERFALAGRTIDHGAAVSFLVSSSYGLGMTEGRASIGDGATEVRIAVERTVAPLLGMLVHRPARDRDGRDSVFCQLQLSARELDDTCKPGAYDTGPRRFRFSVSAV